MLELKAFHSQKAFQDEEELRAGINAVSKVAMQRTLDRMLDKLGEFIEDDIYNAYYPAWYDRTYYLEENYKKIFEEYFWNDFGKGIGGSLKVDTSASFTSIPTLFLHGSGNPNTGTIYSRLNLKSYLEIMNNPNIINSDNPFHFPANNVLGRGRFWDDFMNWAEDNFGKIFKEEFLSIA